MKRIITAVILGSVLMSSCKEWLAVKPFDEVLQEDMFETERSTNYALNGLYLGLTTNALYVKEMGPGMIESMAKHWKVPEPTTGGDHRYWDVSNFNYTTDRAKGLLSATFSGAYKGISNCNEFIAMVEKNREKYGSEKYEMYMGEAIAVRTFLHFDMLRLFGPKGDELNLSAVPYYDASTEQPQPIISGRRMVDTLIMDIDMSIAYLQNDPVLTTGVSLDEQNIEFSSSYRNMRMNYYAANALKARMCLYKGTPDSKAQAYEIASNMLSGRDPVSTSETTNFQDTFFFETDEEIIKFNTYPHEILFGIHNTDRDQVYRDLFSTDLSESTILGAGETFFKELYGGSAAQDSTLQVIAGYDHGPRRDMWAEGFDGTKKVWPFNRYRPQAVNPIYPFIGQFQCLIRLGELYLIAAETAPTTELKRYWLELLRSKKGYADDNTAGADQATLDLIISAEFEKETYGEGQFFFFAKRRNANLKDQNFSVVEMNRATFVPPLPEDETFYREDL